jgi:hypothetical protein
MNTEDSLKALASRLPIPVRTVRGNYRHSILDAWLYTLTGNEYVPAQVPVAGEELRMLLFVQDYPILGRFEFLFSEQSVTYDVKDGGGITIGTVVIDLPADRDCRDAMGIGDSAFISDINTADTSGIILPGEDLRGRTVTNDVRVSGYPVMVALYGRPPYGAANYPFISFFGAFESPVLCGDQSWSIASGGGSGIARKQIILEEPYYTKVICEAGNVIDIVSSGIQYHYQVVGVWKRLGP